MLEGKATARKLTGKINKLDVIYTDTYEIAVKNGFEGTIDEWLASLKGDPGEKGEQGNRGEKGEKGDSPVRGVDYWTEEDKAEIKSYVDDAILGGEW